MARPGETHQRRPLLKSCLIQHSSKTARTHLSHGHLGPSGLNIHLIIHFGDKVSVLLVATLVSPWLDGILDSCDSDEPQLGLATVALKSLL